MAWGVGLRFVPRRDTNYCNAASGERVRLVIRAINAAKALAAALSAMGMR
jgi:hypothetical protein